MHSLLAATLLIAPPIQSMTAQSIVDKVRSAVGVSNGLSQDLLMTGEATRMSVKGSYSLRLSPDGHYLYEFRSALGQKVGYDGKEIWEADYTGATRVLSFDEEDRVRSFGAILTGSWLEKGALASLEMPFAQASQEGYTVHVRLKGSEIDQSVVIDPKTYLPVKVSSDSAAGKVEVLFGNWKSAGPRKMPFSMVFHEGGVKDEISLANAVTVATDLKVYSRPIWRANDVAFDASVSPVLDTKRLRSGHIIVHPRVNGQDVGWFILDSGAEAMCIDKTAADKLGLLRVGEVPAVGIGGVIKVPWRPAREFQLGPGTFKNMMFVELDLAEIGKMLGIELAGIVGYDVFRRSVVEMDVKAPQVRLFEPSAFRLEKGKWQDIRFDGGNIGVEASFEGNRNGWFRLDTGAAGTVSFHGPFVEKFKLLEGREVGTSSEGGVGGMVESRSGTIEYFELAGHRFEKPHASFSIAKVGAFNNKWLVGNIGQVFMDPFVLVFDYPNSRMAFVPR